MVRAMRALTGRGCVVAGRYELLDRIGQGAMGTVWQAKDLVLGRDVAVKEVRLPELVPDRERTILRERTLREARVSAKLSHPGVVTVYDVIEADGTPWIVMELIAARSLDRVLAEDGPLPPHRAAEIGMMLLAALASAHAAGIVHRDVKPGNVLLTPGGRAVLTDFGIAAVDGDPALTQTGMVMGTPGFCAPERIRGGPASPASDLWSLGATLYAAVEGRGPFDGHGSPMAVLASIVHSDPPPAAAAGPLEAVIGALLSKDPAQRPDAARAGKLLADAAEATAVPGTTTGNGASAGPVPASERPAFAAASAAGASARTDPTGFPASTATASTATAGASAQTDPTGFPAIAGPAASPAFLVNAGPAASAAGPGPVTFPPSTGPDGFLASPPPAPAGDSTGTAQFLADGGPDFFLHGTRPAALPAGAGLAGAGLADPGPVPLPVSMGAAPFPGGAGMGGAPFPAGGRLGTAPFPAGAGKGTGPGGRPSPGGRWLVLVLAGAAIVVAGLVAGLLWSRATNPSAHRLPGQAGSAVGTGGGAPTAAAPLPAGYRWYTRPAAPAGTAPGFTMAVPAGWQVRQQGKATFVRNPASGAIISISPAPAAADGPAGEAKLLARAALGRRPLAGNRKIAIAPFLLPGKLASAWRFTYRQPGTGVMDGLVAVTRATTTGGQPYELAATAPAANWPSTRTAFAEAVRTFSPRA
jgi:tRNA A-37 threonylcarbamoyl transferase component Bud32